VEDGSCCGGDGGAVGESELLLWGVRCGHGLCGRGDVEAGVEVCDARGWW
jgi:hypothetical protein